MATIRVYEQEDGSFSVVHRQQTSNWKARQGAMDQVKSLFEHGNQVYITTRDGLESNITREVVRLLTRNRGRQTRRRYRAA